MIYHRQLQQLPAFSGEQPANKNPIASSDAGDTCIICMDVMENPKTLEKCGHAFCTDCIDECFKRSKPACPVCGVMYGKIMGIQPKSGKMTTICEREPLPGYEECGTIIVRYNFPDGKQTVSFCSLHVVDKVVRIKHSQL